MQGTSSDIFRVCHLVLCVDPASRTGLCDLGFLLGNRVSLYPKLYPKLILNLQLSILSAKVAQ